MYKKAAVLTEWDERLIFFYFIGGNIMKSFESQNRRNERIQNAVFLRTRIIEDKKKYKRKKSENLTKQYSSQF